MSVTVRHLNADSSFLLIFSPKKEPRPEDLLSSNGAFSVLIDPWLSGSSIVNAQWFAITHHVVPSAIEHLSEIEEPDVVLVSQNKPDHCHKQTLLQLRPEGKTLIAAEPRAAKAIKSWNHFDPHRVNALAKYDPKQRFGNTLRLRIPPLGPDGVPGELNIAFIPARNYVTGLHNAFGITYQPPTHVKVLAPVSTIELPRNLDISIPFTPASVPAQSPLHMLSHSATRPVSAHDNSTSIASPQRPTTAPGNSMQHQYRDQRLPTSDYLTVPHSQKEHQQRSVTKTASQIVRDINFDANALIDTSDFANTLPTPPLSPSTSSHTTMSPRNSDFSDTTPLSFSASTNSSFPLSLPDSPSLFDLKSRYSRPPIIRPARPKVLSILYSPHGIPLADIQPYIRSHLVPLPGALPLTCLFHGFDHATNPWWFGGNITMGVDGGIEIARALMAQNWISAHDEDKDNKGVGVKLLKCDRNDPETVRRKIAQVDNSWDCEVRSLDAGIEVTLTSYAGLKDSKTPTYSEGEAVGLGVEATGFRFHDGG